MVARYEPDSDQPYLSPGGSFVLYSAYEELRLADANHDWLCGCGHWNGPNLAVCAVCRLSPGNNE
jgi:hypothetical protein